MEQAGRVRAGEFDVDGFAPADIRIAIGLAGRENIGHAALPETVGDPDVDEAGSGDLDRSHAVQPAQAFGYLPGQVARLRAGGFGEDEGGVGRHVAVFRVARRLAGHAVEIRVGGQVPGPGQRGQHPRDLVAKMAENVHAKRVRQRSAAISRSCSFRANRSVIPAI